jgi:type II secretory pathway pseudopilin PulG
MITFLKKQNKKIQERGFTLLFAVLVSTLIISISATVISIAIRQTIISGTSRESQYAFYAANTALECVFYWDKIGITNATTSVIFPAPGESRLAASELNDVKCLGGNITTGAGFDTPFAQKNWDTSVSNETTVFIEVKDTESTAAASLHKYCAQATITKENVSGRIETTIDARGYNTCDLTSPRAVERGLVNKY